MKLNANDYHGTRLKIEEFCGVKNYSKDEHDRDALVSKVTKDNYPKMKERVRKLSTNYERVPSTNILTLFDALDGGRLEMAQLRHGRDKTLTDFRDESGSGKFQPKTVSRWHTERPSLYFGRSNGLNFCQN